MKVEDNQGISIGNARVVEEDIFTENGMFPGLGPVPTSLGWAHVIQAADIFSLNPVLLWAQVLCTSSIS